MSVRVLLIANMANRDNGDIQVNLHVDYVYLDNAERRQFADRLQFNHPVRELIWAAQIFGGEVVNRVNDNNNYPVVNRRINLDKNVCVISLDVIQPGDSYWRCSQCDNSMLKEHAPLWFSDKHYCPTCRNLFDHKQRNTYYINNG